jgi:hypothetical protein
MHYRAVAAINIGFQRNTIRFAFATKNAMQKNTVCTFIIVFTAHAILAQQLHIPTGKNCAQ